MTQARTFRFRTNEGWSRWYCDGDDLSFLHDNHAIEAMEVHQLMPRQEAEKYIKSLEGQ